MSVTGGRGEGRGNVVSCLEIETLGRGVEQIQLHSPVQLLLLVVPISPFPALGERRLSPRRRNLRRGQVHSQRLRRIHPKRAQRRVASPDHLITQRALLPCQRRNHQRPGGVGGGSRVRGAALAASARTGLEKLCCMSGMCMHYTIYGMCMHRTLHSNQSLMLSRVSTSLSTPHEPM